jgi:uncharacterized lipoprotein YajG
MKPIHTAVLVAVGLSVCCGCAAVVHDQPLETPKPKYDGAKVSSKSAAIVEVADTREDKSTYFVGDDKYTSPSNLRLAVMESFAATLREAGFQIVPKDGAADVKLTVTLTVARGEEGAMKSGVAVVAMLVKAQTASGTFERTIVGRDSSSVWWTGGGGARARAALQDAIAVASGEATKACVELVKLEGGGT